SRALIESGRAEAMLEDRLARLQQTLDALQPEEHLVEPLPEIAPPGTAAQTRTAVPLDRLRALNERLLNVPEDFAVNRKLERPRDRRRRMLSNADEPAVDWAAGSSAKTSNVAPSAIVMRCRSEEHTSELQSR